MPPKPKKDGKLLSRWPDSVYGEEHPDLVYFYALGDDRTSSRDVLVCRKDEYHYTNHNDIKWYHIPNPLWEAAQVEANKKMAADAQFHLDFERKLNDAGCGRKQEPERLATIKRVLTDCAMEQPTKKVKTDERNAPVPAPVIATPTPSPTPTPALTHASTPPSPSTTSTPATVAASPILPPLGQTTPTLAQHTPSVTPSKDDSTTRPPAPAAQPSAPHEPQTIAEAVAARIESEKQQHYALPNPSVFAQAPMEAQATNKDTSAPITTSNSPRAAPSAPQLKPNAEGTNHSAQRDGIRAQPSNQPEQAGMTSTTVNGDSNATTIAQTSHYPSASRSATSIPGQTPQTFQHQQVQGQQGQYVVSNSSPGLQHGQDVQKQPETQQRQQTQNNPQQPHGSASGFTLPNNVQKFPQESPGGRDPYLDLLKQQVHWGSFSSHQAVEMYVRYRATLCPKQQNAARKLSQRTNPGQQGRAFVQQHDQPFVRQPTLGGLQVLSQGQQPSTAAPVQQHTAPTQYQDLQFAVPPQLHPQLGQGGNAPPTLYQDLQFAPPALYQDLQFANPSQLDLQPGQGGNALPTLYQDLQFANSSQLDLQPGQGGNALPTLYQDLQFANPSQLEPGQGGNAPATLYQDLQFANPSQLDLQPGQGGNALPTLYQDLQFANSSQLDLQPGQGGNTLPTLYQDLQFANSSQLDLQPGQGGNALPTLYQDLQFANPSQLEPGQGGNALQTLYQDLQFANPSQLDLQPGQGGNAPPGMQQHPVFQQPAQSGDYLQGLQPFTPFTPFTNAPGAPTPQQAWASPQNPDPQSSRGPMSR